MQITTHILICIPTRAASPTKGGGGLARLRFRARFAEASMTLETPLRNADAKAR